VEDHDGYSFFDIDVEGSIVVATFNGPDERNRWAKADVPEIHRLARWVADDQDVRVLVFTGAGEHFSGGAHHGDDPFDPGLYYLRAAQTFAMFINLDKPLVVAINGPLSGSGLTYAMFGDVVIAERHVRFADTHVVNGVVTATGAFEWPPNIGLGLARRYLLTGDSFSADEARQMGLIAEVVETGESLPRAMEHARHIASLPPAGVQGTKRALMRRLRQELGPVLEHGLALEFLNFPPGRY
jgi:enoyl-CoA hydratase